jgi:hypothetical protein
MACGVYGITRPSDVNINDIDVYYNYIPNRETSNNTIYKLDAVQLLTYNYLPDEVIVDNNSNPISYNEKLLEGLYNLRLPASVFSQLGIYTIYIKPKSFFIRIQDVGVLSALPNVRGIILDINGLPEGLRGNNAMQGYRIEYIDIVTNNKIRNVVRYIVTSNRVVPINENIGNTSQKTIRYKFDDSGSLIFLQLTPSSSTDVKPNVSPFIGSSTQQIIISNTFFNPIAIEVDLVENTIDTLSDLVGGEQIKDVDNGILTYYDKNRVITKQFNIFEIKDDVGDVSLYEVKEKRTSIDETQNFDDVISEIQ